MTRPRPSWTRLALRRAAAVACSAALALGTAAAPATASVTTPAAASSSSSSSSPDRAALDSAGVVVDPASPPPPAVTAQSWVVADLDSGDVLAASNARVPLAPASTLKLLTLLALAPDLDRSTLYSALPADAAVDGSKVGLDPGSVYTVDDLLHGLMLASGNDAANALATLSGGMPAATKRMQQRARDLGATDTVVRNTSGLDADGQVSTAFDLALIGRAVLEDPELAELVTTTRYAFPGAGSTHGPERPRFEIANHNRLLTSYEGALGLKNGYTQAARGSFVAGVERDGRRYVVALMAAEGVTWQLSQDLLDWALAGGGDGAPVASLGPPPGSTVEALRVDTVAGDEPAVAPDVQAAAGAGGVPGLLVTPGVVLLLLALLVVGLRVRAVRRRRRRRAARRRPPLPAR